MKKNNSSALAVVTVMMILSSTIVRANPHAPAAAAAAPPAVAGPAPSPVPPPVETITPVIAKKLLPEFLRAQNSELKAFEHRYKLELKELKASQSARQKDWERQEKDARHKYFAEHTRGPDRRSYIKDFMERRRAFIQLLTDERTQRTREQEVRVTSLKSDHAQRLKEFKEALARNEQPAARLWPGAS